MVVAGTYTHRKERRQGPVLVEEEYKSTESGFWLGRMTQEMLEML